MQSSKPSAKIVSVTTGDTAANPVDRSKMPPVEYPATGSAIVASNPKHALFACAGVPALMMWALIENVGLSAAHVIATGLNSAATIIRMCMVPRIDAARVDFRMTQCNELCSSTSVEMSAARSSGGRRNRYKCAQRYRDSSLAESFANAVTITAFDFVLYPVLAWAASIMSCSLLRTESRIP